MGNTPPESEDGWEPQWQFQIDCEDPAPGVFVVFRRGCTLLQHLDFIHYAWLPPLVLKWAQHVVKHPWASMDELAESYDIACTEIESVIPPSSKGVTHCDPIIATRHFPAAASGHPAFSECFFGERVSKSDARKVWEDQRAGSGDKDNDFFPVYPFRCAAAAPEYCPEFRWLRFAVNLISAKGDFTPEHQLMGAELAARLAIECLEIQKDEDAPVLEVGKSAINARWKARRAKQPTQMAIQTRNAGICHEAIERRNAGKKKVATVQFLMEKHKLEKRQIEGILQEGGVYWRKTP